MDVVTHILKDDFAKLGVQRNYGCCHAYFEGRLCEAWSPEEYGKFVRFQWQRCKGCKYLVIYEL